MAERFTPLETLEHGPFSAWRLDWSAKLRAEGYEPAHDAGLASWIIQAPWAHPTWHSYWLHVVHLRPIDRGSGPIETKFYLAGATHELWLYALNPDVPLAEIVGEAKPFECTLTPKNYADQLILENDEAAIALAAATAKDVLEARLNPDTDAQGQWIARFGGHMLKPEYRR